MARYETKIYEIQEEFQNVCIAVRDANVVIKALENGPCTVSFHEKARRPHTVKVKNDTLTVTCAQKRKWYHLLHMNCSLPQVEICLPKAIYGTVTVKNVTGKRTVSDTACQELDLHGTTGAVTLSNVIASGDIRIRHVTGKVVLSDCDANALSVKVTTGSVCGRLLSAKIFAAKCTTGKIHVPNPPAGGLCKIKTTTGNIKFEQPPR